MRTVRGVKLEDADAIWRILEPMVRAGETYPLPREMNKDEALAYWMGTDHEVFVAEEDGEIVGTYFLKANQKGGGAHVANCGYVTAAAAQGRGLARMMCHHSIERAKERAFRAMQFNFVVATNANAVRFVTIERRQRNLQPDRSGRHSLGARRSSNRLGRSSLTHQLPRPSLYLSRAG